jgi:hypothetical protein
LSRSFKSVNSIQNYISGVKTLHLLAGFEFPSENWFSVKLLYRGLARENPHLPHKGITNYSWYSTSDAQKTWYVKFSRCNLLVFLFVCLFLDGKKIKFGTGFC